MKNFKSFFSIVFVVLLAITFFAPSQSAKAQGVGIKISPVKVEDVVDPGQTYQGSLKVTNEANEDRTFYVYLKDFKAGDESGSPIIIAPGSEEGYFLASWIDITADAIPLKAGEEVRIPYSIKVPEETGPGGYFGGVYFGTKPPKLNLNSGDQGAGMSIAQQAGSLILLRVKGDVYEEAFVREFTTDKNYYSTPFDVKFITRIENKGNVHVKPYGAIRITDMFGREKETIVVNKQGGNILPKSVRRYNNEWSGKYGFGRYNAEIGLTYGQTVDKGGQGMQSMVAYQSFWIIPWKIIGPFLLVIGLIFGLLLLTVKIYKDKAVKRAVGEAGIKKVKSMATKGRGDSSLAHSLIILLTVIIILFLIFMSVYFLFFA